MYFDTEIRVRYAETDQMGVVYHANYFPWFEEARTNFLESIGLPYDRLEQEGLLIPVLECNCRYRSPARFGMRVIVRAWVEGMKGVQFFVAYKVLDKADGRLLAEGRTAHVFVDKEFRPVMMARTRPDVWEALRERVSASPEE